MENHFYTLHDFLVYTKGAAYYLMGAMLLGILGFWLYHHRQGRGERHQIALRAATRPCGGVAYVSSHNWPPTVAILRNLHRRADRAGGALYPGPGLEARPRGLQGSSASGHPGRHPIYHSLAHALRVVRLARQAPLHHHFLRLIMSAWWSPRCSWPDMRSSSSSAGACTGRRSPWPWPTF